MSPFIIKHLLYLSTSMLHDHDNYPINIKSSRPSSVMSWVRETQAYLKAFISSAPRYGK